MKMNCSTKRKEQRYYKRLEKSLQPYMDLELELKIQQFDKKEEVNEAKNKEMLMKSVNIKELNKIVKEFSTFNKLK